MREDENGEEGEERAGREKAVWNGGGDSGLEEKCGEGSGENCGAVAAVSVWLPAA